jgi:hypothetical protein
VHVTEAAAATFLAELRDGWREVISRTWVWTIIAGFSLANCVHAAFLVLGPLVAKQSLGGAGAWATILACRDIGQICGGITALRARPRRPRRSP